jgi:ferric-dicitrate binding protein FerR (iron transport regulator)
MSREEMFEKHFRGELAPHETEQLKCLLASDPEAGRAFVEFSNETALIVRVGTQLQSAWPAENVVSLPAAVANDAVATPPSVRRRRFPRGAWITAMAACAIGLLVLFAFLQRTASPPRVPDVYVSGEGIQITRNGAVRSGRNIELMPGDVIATAMNKPGTIVYEREPTRVVLQPSTVLVFGDAAHGKRFELRRGTVQARVAPQPKDSPMSVETAHVYATVIGTEFVMRADDRATKLDVLDGKVRLTCRVTGKSVKVKAGFAASIHRKAPFNVAPLCKTNCILRDSPDTNDLLRTFTLEKHK